MNKPFLKLALDSASALELVSERLAAHGLRVVHTFDLQSACGGMDNVCPHHDCAPCDCQLAVLVITRESHAPVSLVAHSVDGITEFELSSSFDGPVEPLLKSAVQNALLPLLRKDSDPVRKGEG